MVVHDEEFKIDLTELSDKKLKKRRHSFVSQLFAGQKGSPDNVEKEALIKEIDIEIEMRFKKGTEKRSNIALIVSIVSLVISALLLIWKIHD